MAESSLAAPWDELRKRVAFDRGYPTDPTVWDTRQIEIIEMCLRSGARLFYKPRPIAGPPHEWSFLKPTFDLVLPVSERDVPLPADFGFLVDQLYFVDNTVTYMRPLQLKNIGKIQQYRQQATQTVSQPEFAAVASDSDPSALKGQRFMLMLWPTPDREYTVTGRYSVLPEALDPSRPYPYGGAAHAETLIQACLAASEQLNGTPGPHSAHFAECLASSIEYDRRVGAQTIDNVDGRRGRRGWSKDGRLTPWWNEPSTYNGQYSN